MPFLFRREPGIRETRHTPPGILLVLAATQKVTSSWPISLKSRAASVPPACRACVGRLWNGGFFSSGKAARARGAVGAGREGSHGGPGSCKRAGQSGGWWGRRGVSRAGDGPPTKVRPSPQPRTPWVVPSAGQASWDQRLGLSHSRCDLGQVISPVFDEVGVRSPPAGAEVHIQEERIVSVSRVSQMVAVSIPLIHTHITYTLQVGKTWFVSSLTDCSRSLHLAPADRSIHKRC